MRFPRLFSSLDSLARTAPGGNSGVFSPRPVRHCFPFAGSRLHLTVTTEETLHAAPPWRHGSGAPVQLWLRSSDDRLALSGKVAPRESFPGRLPLLWQETRRRESHRLPVPVNIAFAEINRWQVMMYDLSAGSSTSGIFAQWLTEKDWVELRLVSRGPERRPPPLHRLIALIGAATIESREEDAPRSTGAGPPT